MRADDAPPNPVARWLGGGGGVSKGRAGVKARVGEAGPLNESCVNGAICTAAKLAPRYICAPLPCLPCPVTRRHWPQTGRRPTPCTPTDVFSWLVGQHPNSQACCCAVDPWPLTTTSTKSPSQWMVGGTCYLSPTRPHSDEWGCDHAISAWLLQTLVERSRLFHASEHGTC